MARSATCPACEDRVPVPAGTRPNTPVRCPACDQAFVPPWLRVDVVDDEDEPYDPKTAEAYSVKQAAGKKMRAKVTAKSQVEEDDENWKPQRGGPEWILLLLGVGFGVVIPAAFLLGKWAVTKNVGTVAVLVCVCLLLIGLWFVGAYLNLFRIRDNLRRLFGPW
jgi:hypothetical protein